MLILRSRNCDIGCACLCALQSGFSFNDGNLVGDAGFVLRPGKFEFKANQESRFGLRMQIGSETRQWRRNRRGKGASMDPNHPAALGAGQRPARAARPGRCPVNRAGLSRRGLRGEPFGRGGGRARRHPFPGVHAEAMGAVESDGAAHPDGAGCRRGIPGRGRRCRSAR